MLKKKMKWLLVPAVAAIVFFTVSSFTDAAEDPIGGCWVITPGHYGPVVGGMQTIECDGTGTLSCSTKVDCKTGKSL